MQPISRLANHTPPLPLLKGPRMPRQCTNLQIQNPPIKKLRLKLGLTQDELARKLGITNTTLSRWERNHTHLGELTWLGILAKLQKEAEEKDENVIQT